MVSQPEHFPKLSRRTYYTKKRNYKDYRQEIQEDCQHRCVYCDCHEKEVGGERTMTIDHLRPRSLYPSLTNDPINLLWGCYPCNQLKGNDWPAHGKPGTVDGNFGYIDPFSVDRKEYFSIAKDGELIALKPPAAYMIHTLSLNREFLRLNRLRRNISYRILSRLEKYFERQRQIDEKLLNSNTLSDAERHGLQRELLEVKELEISIAELGSFFEISKT